MVVGRSEAREQKYLNVIDKYNNALEVRLCHRYRHAIAYKVVSLQKLPPVSQLFSTDH